MPSDPADPEVHREGPGSDDWLSLVGTGSEMATRVATHDWASTPLGPLSEWPPVLRSAVSMCLDTRFPMLVAWGPELVKIYNDGYRDMLGTSKHPAALGAPAAEVWTEIWHIIGPMFDAVLRTGEATWVEHQLLIIDRNGYYEECYFTYSYSPLRDADGAIRGVLDVATETTEQVVVERRLACVGALSGAVLGAGAVTDVCLRAATALWSHQADILFADIYLRVGDQLPLVASSRRDTRPRSAPDLLWRAAGERTSFTVGGTADGSQPADQRIVFIESASGQADAVLVVDLNPFRPFDESYERFLDLVGTTIGSALESAYRRAVEVDEQRAISDTLQQAMLTPVSDFPTVAARYLPAVGSLSVGGDWYDVIDVTPDRRALVVGDCVGHGLEAATAMGQLRAAARAMLLEGRGPADTLEGLDVFAESLDRAFGATVVCVVIDRPSGTITYSRAGHPPPLVVGADGTMWLDRAGGLPLAVVPNSGRTNDTRPLHPDDVVILYSDGLVERRHEVLDVGLERLAVAARSLYGDTVHNIADGLLEQLHDDADEADDVVLIVKQMRS